MLASAPLSQQEFWFAYYAVNDFRLTTEYQWTLPWSDRFVLRLEAGPEENRLSLVTIAGGRAHPLGWSDNARWHPYVFRWCELGSMLEEWASSDRLPTLPTPLPLLLLSGFVGFGSDELAERKSAETAVSAAYRTLGFPQADIDILTSKALPKISEEDYRWRLDPELGYVFGGEYACYSLRNREHLGGEEGVFPFEEFRRMFD